MAAPPGGLEPGSYASAAEGSAAGPENGTNWRFSRRGPEPARSIGYGSVLDAKGTRAGALVSAVAWAVFATAALSAQGAEQPRAIG